MNDLSYPKALLCVANEGNEVSLLLWKIYKPLRDDDARSEGLVRVVDETGEDYLFPEENFVPIELPSSVQRPFERAVKEHRRAATAPRSSAAAKRVGRAAAGSKRRAGSGA
jgi:hypothetical protein